MKIVLVDFNNHNGKSCYYYYVHDSYVCKVGDIVHINNSTATVVSYNINSKKIHHIVNKMKELTFWNFTGIRFCQNMYRYLTYRIIL